MADANTQDWYPPPGHPREDTDRIIFDNLYTLRNQVSTPAGPTSNANSGMSITVVFANNNGFKIGNKSYHSMTFSNGLLVGVS